MEQMAGDGVGDRLLPVEHATAGEALPVGQAVPALELGVQDQAVMELSGADFGVWLEPSAERERGLLTAKPWQLRAKRAIDIMVSVLALLLLSPILLLVALAVWTTSPGPVLYVQDRIGKAGRPFKLFKFRSMYRDADRMKEQHLGMNEVSGPIFKIRRDPRITPVGRIIRKLSIDEVPQLINVLRGEMSLVGPRPPLPEEYERYGPRERERVLVTPGITCIWQVSGRSDLDFDTWVDMDLEYIRNWSLSLDLKLLALTIPAVLSCRGAY